MRRVREVRDEGEEFEGMVGRYKKEKGKWI